MKKQYKLSIEYDDDEVDALSDVISEVTISDEDGIWLDTGDKTIQLPAEIAKYIESEGILGIA